MRLNKTRGQETTLEQVFMGTTGLEPVTCAQPPALLDQDVNPHSARVWRHRHTQHQTPSIKKRVVRRPRWNRVWYPNIDRAGVLTERYPTTCGLNKTRGQETTLEQGFDPFDPFVACFAADTKCLA